MVLGRKHNVTFIFILLLLTTVSVHGQWVSNGPYADSTAKVDAISLITNENDVFVGTWFEGILKSTDNGVTWMPVNNGLVIDPVNAFTISGTNLFAGTYWSGGGIFRSTDNGGNWEALNYEAGRGVYALGSYVSGNGDTTLFCSHDFKVSRSIDQGTSWEDVHLNWTVNSFALIGINIFAGTGTGGVFLSTDNGVSWGSIGNGLTSAGIRSLDTMAVEGATYLFAGTNGGVFFSSDTGANWTLRWPTPNNIRCIKVYQRTLFAGTYTGVYSSGNLGVTWTYNGLPYPISMLAVNDTYLFAGPKAYYGVWQRPLSQVTSINEASSVIQESFSLDDNYPNPFNPSTTISFILSRPAHISVEIFDILGVKIVTLLNKRLDTGRHQVIWEPEDNTSGIYYFRVCANDGEWTATKKMILLR